MLTIQQLLQSIRPGDWFTVVDLKDAFFRIPIKPAHWKYLRFTFQGTVYEFRVPVLAPLRLNRVLTGVRINVLELQEVYLALQHFLQEVRGRHVLVHTDNTTVVAYINDQSSLGSFILHHVACKLLLWAHENLLCPIWALAYYVDRTKSWGQSKQFCVCYGRSPMVNSCLSRGCPNG
ncbi:UNVERIFIED_CONTAM: hypothetical protein FKN15_031049 [Acipenser sinensis]